MRAVTDRPTPVPPGERRLDRPPSERFREAPAEDPASGGPRVGRAIAAAAVASVAGAAGTVILGGVLGLTAGLLVVAGVTGWAIGYGVRSIGAGLEGRVRLTLAVAFALLAVILGQVGLWWYAGTEGGVLPLIDYLGQTYGPLVPLQAVLTVGLAGWAAR
jgi:hypothetical protein